MSRYFLVSIFTILLTNSFAQSKSHSEKARAEVDSVMKIQNFDKIIDEMIITDTTNIDILFARTVGLCESKRGLEALAMLDKVLAPRPKDYRLLTLKSMALYSLSNDDQVTYYSKEVKNNPDEPSNYLSLAQAYSGQEKYKEALTYYEKAVKLNPTSEFYLYERAKCKLRLGMKTQACEELNSLKLFEAKLFREENCK